MKQLEESFDIHASQSKVWKTLTEPEQTREYMFGCEIVTDWSIGSPFLWRGAADSVVYVKGRLVRLEPERLLEFTVIDANGDIEDIPENYLSLVYELFPNGEHTTLKITQGDFSTVAKGEARYQDAIKNGPLVWPRIKEIAER